MKAFLIAILLGSASLATAGLTTPFEATCGPFRDGAGDDSEGYWVQSDVARDGVHYFRVMFPEPFSQDFVLNNVNYGSDNRGFQYILDWAPQEGTPELLKAARPVISAIEKFPFAEKDIYFRPEDCRVDQNKRTFECSATVFYGTLGDQALRQNQPEFENLKISSDFNSMPVMNFSATDVVPVINSENIAQFRYVSLPAANLRFSYRLDGKDYEFALTMAQDPEFPELSCHFSN